MIILFILIRFKISTGNQGVKMNKKMKMSIHVKERGSYLIKVVRTGEIVEKFRVKAAALTNLSRLRKEVGEDIEIVKNG